MQVEFYGVRGSVPSPGPETCHYGGNTSCVLVTGEDNNRIILDSGTGIIKLGEELLHDQSDINILVTHNHWDHIQGFPFFKPIYQAGRKINIFPGQVEDAEKDAILKQMSKSTFPVKATDLPSSINLDSNITAKPNFSIGNTTVYTMALNHPDGGTAYLLKQGECKLAYVTDNELCPPGEVKTTIEEWVEFVKGADLLIHDGQFIDIDLPEKSGWGHSTVLQVAELAVQANVKALALISHDPFRTDDALKIIETQLQKHYGARLHVFCAREGQKLDLNDFS